MNRGLATALVSVGVAQFMKVPLAYGKTGKWDWSHVGQAGGMPSSHSAGVAALAAYTAMKKGVGSVEFALSALFGIIVMYDAMGIRRHAGEIAVEVNALDQRVEELADEHPGFYHKRRRHELEERLGHMPAEVVGGTVLGTAIGLVSYYRECRNQSNKLKFLLGWE